MNDKLLEEFQEKFRLYGYSATESIEDWLIYAFSQARQSALEEALACVPGERACPYSDHSAPEVILDSTIGDHNNYGHNKCRTQTIEAIKKLVV